MPRNSRIKPPPIPPDKLLTLAALASEAVGNSLGDTSALNIDLRLLDDGDKLKEILSELKLTRDSLFEAGLIVQMPTGRTDRYFPPSEADLVEDSTAWLCVEKARELADSTRKNKEKPRLR